MENYDKGMFTEWYNTQNDENTLKGSTTEKSVFVIEILKDEGYKFTGDKKYIAKSFCFDKKSKVLEFFDIEAVMKKTVDLNKLDGNECLWISGIDLTARIISKRK